MSGLEVAIALGFAFSVVGGVVLWSVLLVRIAIEQHDNDGET